MEFGAGAVGGSGTGRGGGPSTAEVPTDGRLGYAENARCNFSSKLQMPSHSVAGTPKRVGGKTVCQGTTSPKGGRVWEKQPQSGQDPCTWESRNQPLRREQAEAGGGLRKPLAGPGSPRG